MVKKKSKPTSPFLGRWHIVSMSTWDESYFNEEVEAYIEFKEERHGESQFGDAWGELGYREGQRDGEPAVELSWEGSDGAGGRPLSGRGWARVKDEGLHGLILDAARGRQAGPDHPGGVPEDAPRSHAPDDAAVRHRAIPVRRPGAYLTGLPMA